MMKCKWVGCYTKIPFFPFFQSSKQWDSETLSPATSGGRKKIIIFSFSYGFHGTMAYVRHKIPISGKENIDGVTILVAN